MLRGGVTLTEPGPSLGWTKYILVWSSYGSMGGALRVGTIDEEIWEENQRNKKKGMKGWIEMENDTMLECWKTHEEDEKRNIKMREKLQLYWFNSTYQRDYNQLYT